MRANMLEAKTELSQMVKNALAGEEVVIACNGEPTVEFVVIARKAI